jgi:hypothetical protein
LKTKVLATLVTVFLVGGLLVATAGPALADDPPASFLPDGDGAAGADGDVLSDRFDGVDTLAHLTVVAPIDTRE